MTVLHTKMQRVELKYLLQVNYWMLGMNDTSGFFVSWSFASAYIAFRSEPGWLTAIELIVTRVIKLSKI